MQIPLKVLPKQAALLRSRAPIVAFVGGFGSGKTRGAVYKALQLGVMNAPCLGMFVAPTYTLLRDSSIRSFEEVLHELNMPYVYHRTDAIITVADTFDILFRSGDQPERLVAINAGWAIIDEPAKQSEDVAKMVSGRIRDPRAKLKQLVLTGTPEGFNWFYDWVHREGTDVIRSKTSENPFVGPEYASELRKHYTDEEVAAYLDGEFIRFEGTWYASIPRLAPFRPTPSGLKIFVEPHSASDRVVVGADTAGGLGRDRSAVAVIDRRDQRLLATWVSDTATIHELTSVVMECDALYTKYKTPMAPYLRSDPPARPVIVVEVDGIGRATWQDLMMRDPTMRMTQLKTKEHTRYNGLLAAKRLVESGTIFGPEELQEEARSLYAEDQRFKGKKDLSMAIGFCLNEINADPFKNATPPPDPNLLRMQEYLKPHKRGW